ncbi:MAG: hypothetical protein KGV48_002035 [Alcaligenaceae bacterium]|nr:hypothetical protein [Alcaligenaceae bacterium]
MTNKMIFSSKKYVVLSWYIVLLIIWVALILYFYYFIDPFVGTVIGVVNFILMLTTILRRFWYINMYTDYIEVKHVFIPFFRRKFNIKQIRSIIFKYEIAGASSAGFRTYIPCMILNFENIEKKSKIYWNVISFYKNYHETVYYHWDKIKSNKSDPFFQNEYV